MPRPMPASTAPGRPTAPARPRQAGGGLPRLLAWAAVLAALATTFLAWLQPAVMLDLTNRLMACF